MDPDRKGGGQEQIAADDANRSESLDQTTLYYRKPLLILFNYNLDEVQGPEFSIYTGTSPAHYHSDEYLFIYISGFVLIRGVVFGLAQLPLDLSQVGSERPDRVQNHRTLLKQIQEYFYNP